jgi:major membrane immunogen (membrane-anchored lipoprotein)
MLNDTMHRLSKRKALATIILLLFLISITAELGIVPKVKADNSLNGYSNAIQISGTSLNTTTPIRLAYGYYTVNPYQQVVKQTCVKPVILNGHRYIFVDSGWGLGQYDSIKAYIADINWNTVSLEATTLQTNYNDFYVASFPEVWRDLIVVYGTTSNGIMPTGGFVQAFNTTSNAFSNLTVTSPSLATYITGISWVPEHNEFLLTMINVLATATPSTLFNCAEWNTCYNNTGVIGGGGEMRQAYFSQDDCSYIGFVNITSNLGTIVKWDLTSGIFSTAFQTIYNANTQNYTGQYTTSNSTTVFQSFNDGTHYHYYYSDDGKTWTDFAQLPIVGQGYVWTGISERHGSVLPICNNQVLLGDAGDGNWSSYFALSNTETGAIIEKYYTNSHTDAGGKFVFDQNNTEIVIGGEGAPFDGSQPIILTIGLAYKGSSDFTDINFCKSDKTTPLNFNKFNVVNGSYAEFALDTSTITGNNSFYVYFGKKGQTSLSNSSVSATGLAIDNTGLQFDAMNSLNSQSDGLEITTPTAATSTPIAAEISPISTLILLSTLLLIVVFTISRKRQHKRSQQSIPIRQK